MFVFRISLVEFSTHDIGPTTASGTMRTDGPNDAAHGGSQTMAAKKTAKKKTAKRSTKKRKTKR